MFHNNAPGIHGHVSRGCRVVREAFTENFAEISPVYSVVILASLCPIC
jgi:hypothetical protein